MIKIESQPAKRYHLTCDKCGTAFSYEIEDVKPNYLHGGSEGVYCPACGKWRSHTYQEGRRR